MMRKLMMAAALMVASANYAQNVATGETVAYSNGKNHVETNSANGNWFVRVGAGGLIYFGDHDKQCSFGDRIAPAFDLAMGKWITPGIGVELMYSGLQAKGATQMGIHDEGVEVPGKGGHGYWLNKQKFSFGNIHADVLFNLRNLFCGYSESRVWNISPYVGVGYGCVYESPKADKVTLNLGVLNSFSVSRSLDVNLDVHGFLVSDHFDGEPGGRSGEGALSVSVGLTYKIPSR